MPREFFLVPMIGDGSEADPHRAKYSDGAAAHGCVRSAHREVGVVMLFAGQAYLDNVAGQADARRICTVAQLNDAPTNPQRTAISDALEALRIPADWLTAGDTWRVVIRTVCHFFFLDQRLEGSFAKPLHAQIPQWERTYSQLSSAEQNALLAIRDRQGWTNEELGLTANSTVREIVRAMGRQGVGLRRRLARHSLTLSSQWSDLPAGMRDDLREVVTSFGFDPAGLGLSGASTLRQILKAFADQFANLPVVVNGVWV